MGTVLKVGVDLARPAGVDAAHAKGHVRRRHRLGADQVLCGSVAERDIVGGALYDVYREIVAARNGRGEGLAGLGGVGRAACVGGEHARGLLGEGCGHFTVYLCSW